MGASNFHDVNASRVFAVKIEEDYELDDLKDNLKEALKKLSGWSEGASDEHELRSYSSHGLISLWRANHWQNYSAELIVGIFIRSGYYAGVNLDWDVRLEIGGCEADWDRIAEALEYNCDMSEKMAKYKAKFAQAWAEKAKAELIEKVEKVFAEYSTPLRVLGTASNGETFYEKVSC